MPDTTNAQEVIEPVEETPAEETPETEAAAVEVEAEPKVEPEVSIENIVSGAKSGTSNGVQKRIDELTREKYEAKKEAEEWRKKVETVSTAVSQTSEIPSDRPLPPAELEFDTTEEFQKARAAYEDNLEAWREKKRAASTDAVKTQQEQDGLAKKFVVDAKRVAEKYPDFHEAVNQPIFSPQVVSAIFSSDYAPEIGYYLAKNPAINDRLHSLDLLSLGREIGKIEVKFSEATARLVTSAPAPIKPLEGNDTPPKDPSSLPIDEWMKWNDAERMKKIKKKIEGG